MDTEYLYDALLGLLDCHFEWEYCRRHQQTGCLDELKRFDAARDNLKEVLQLEGDFSDSGWQVDGKHGEYTFYKRFDDESKKWVYNVTKTGRPPVSEAGYYDRNYLLDVKGVPLTSLIRGREPISKTVKMVGRRFPHGTTYLAPEDAWLKMLGR